MAKVRVQLREKRQYYVHNDLINSAFYFKNLCEHRIKFGDLEGVGHELIAGIVVLAFATEAKFNFLGDRLVKDWKERTAALEKVTLVCQQVGIAPNFDSRPYSSVKKLKEFRDIVAHGKPVKFSTEETVVVTHEELEKMDDWKPNWQKLATLDFLQEAFVDIESIWVDLLKRSGLEIFDSIMQGESSVSFIEYVDH